MRTLILIALSGALVWGCGDNDGRPGTDAGRDTRGPVDGGTDTATPLDTGMMDTSVDTGGGGMCPPGVCDLLGSDCAAGEACYFVSMMMGVDPSPMCLPAGTAGDGMTCPNATDCQEGFVCLLEDGPDMDGTCRQICCGGSSTACTPPGATCRMIADSGFGTCFLPDGCDLVAQTGCDAGQSCVVVGEDGSSSCVRTPAETTPTGSMCGAGVPACAPGNFCIGPVDGPSFCRQACSLTTPACSTGTCTMANGLPAAVGYCDVPMM